MRLWFSNVTSSRTTSRTAQQSSWSGTLVKYRRSRSSDTSSSARERKIPSRAARRASSLMSVPMTRSVQSRRRYMFSSRQMAIVYGSAPLAHPADQIRSSRGCDPRRSSATTSVTKSDRSHSKWAGVRKNDVSFVVTASRKCPISCMPPADVRKR